LVDTKQYKILSSVTEKRTLGPDGAQGQLRAENPVCNSVQSRPWPPEFGGLKKEAAQTAVFVMSRVFYHLRIADPSSRDFPEPVCG
jgi:hypothetical protein